VCVIEIGKRHILTEGRLGKSHKTFEPVGFSKWGIKNISFMTRQPYMGLGLLVSSRFHDHTL
jgi:hypothetical protein